MAGVDPVALPRDVVLADPLLPRFFPSSFFCSSSPPWFVRPESACGLPLLTARFTNIADGESGEPLRIGGGDSLFLIS